MSDRKIIGQRQDGYVAFVEGLYEGLMDNEGNVVISPSLGYRSIGEFVDGVAIGFRLDHKSEEGGWGLLNERGEKITEFRYWYIEPFAGHNLYLVHVTPGLRKNLMWNDGRLVFQNSYQEIYKRSYRRGYMVCGNTIRKTKTTPTRYPQGLLHVSGVEVLPVEYDSIEWHHDHDDIICTKREGRFGYVRALYGDAVGVEYDVMLDDMWLGVKGTVCEGCIYSRGIDSEGKGCGKLFTKSFRDRNIQGRCEYRKTSLADLSTFELRRIEYWKEQMRIADPLDEHRRLLQDFIKEKLDGDIRRLADYDLRDLKGDGRYGDCLGRSFCLDWSVVARAICALAFADAFGTDAFDKKGRLNLQCGKLLGEHMWGGTAWEGDDYYMFHVYHSHFTEEQKQSVRHCAHLCNTIGNLWTNPGNFIEYRHSQYIDQSLCNLCQSLENYKYKPCKQDYFLSNYTGNYGFARLAEALVLDDLVDYHGNPEPLFKGLVLNPNVVTASQYFPALEEYMQVCREVIPKRTKAMVQRIRAVLY